MGFSIRRIRTLVMKEIKDLSKNMNVLLVCLLPLVFAMVYPRLNVAQTFNGMVLSTFFIMNSSMIAPVAMAMLISEEKEKNTLRTLMLSTVSPMEFLLGKAIVMWLLVNLTNIGIFFTLHTPIKYLLHYAINAILLSIIMILVGAVVGILSKNLMSAGTNSMPILLLFYMIPSIAKVKENIKPIAYLFPTYHSEELIDQLLHNDNIYQSGYQHYSVLLIWIIIATITFSVIYKHRRLDY